MEVAAGLVIAEEVISSILEGGAVATYAIAKPTLPLKCTLTQFARAPEDGSSGSLARKHHTISVINGDIYIFGGRVAQDKLAGNEMHILLLSNHGGLGPQYKCVPAIARDGESDTVPGARAGHTASVIGEDIIVFGGYDDPKTQRPIDEKSRVWIFSTATLQWTHQDSSAAGPLRALHAAVPRDKESVIFHGGIGRDEKPLSDTWSYSLKSNAWTELSSLSRPEAGTNLPPSLAIAGSTVYLISNHSDSALSNTIYTLDLDSAPTAAPPQWAAVPFPTNPLTPGPTPRAGAGLATLYTGQGRTYLLYLLGSKTGAAAGPARPQSSSIWALQLASAGASGAGVKDAIRSGLGAATHEAEWCECEVDVAAPAEQQAGSSSASQGKAHPGPRAWFACDVVPGGAFGSGQVLLWGGEDAAGALCADGWLVRIKTPSALGVLKNVPGVGRLVKGDDE